MRSRLRDLRVAGRKLSLAEALDLSIAMLEGLAHAHRNGILHRDMKPANLIFTAEGALKITVVEGQRFQVTDVKFALGRPLARDGEQGISRVDP